MGHRLAQAHKPYALEPAPHHRLERVTTVLEKMGGRPTIQETNDTYRIEGASCPFASLVEIHGELACTLARALLEELTQLPVKQQCRARGEDPQCAFVVEKVTD